MLLSALCAPLFFPRAVKHLLQFDLQVGRQMTMEKLNTLNAFGLSAAAYKFEKPLVRKH